MTDECFICIRTILGSIGVGKAVKGVKVSGFNRLQPGLFDWKAKAGVIKAN
jgi:hypothetical protein